MNQIIPPPAKIGIIGGGQLGKMLASAAKRMGYHVIVLDPNPSAPAGQVSDEQIVADFSDTEAIRKLAAEVAVTTFEFEHIDAGILIELEREGHRIVPSGSSLQIIQDKFVQKTFLSSAGIPVPAFTAVTTLKGLREFVSAHGFPLVIKSRKGGYDGKGTAIIEDEEQLKRVIKQTPDTSCMVEQHVTFKRELSVLAARNASGQVQLYPVAENMHEQSILQMSRVPALISMEVEKAALQISERVLAAFQDEGVFCIELFQTQDNRILVNEVAPRPHNTGHYSIEACVTSQFEQLVRIMTGLPLGSTRLRSPCVMANVLGHPAYQGPYTIQGLEKVLSAEDIHVHLYGKKQTAHLKKLGHLTALGGNVLLAERKCLQALDRLNVMPSTKQD
ncbi:MAG: 5-(carboxyamino)imidazole ribonucleotide synthase [Clostridia bacterium]|nr:5-(carboxyamino)imidazole ribonucleotide synthase [Clostridia bacterium]NCC75573.1 5-(carboxyamino)imidazole ribonucleotide synthase [Clostridia bacterium]